MKELGFHINPAIYAWGSSDPSGGSAATGTSMQTEKGFAATPVMAKNTAGNGSAREVPARANGDPVEHFTKARIRRGNNMTRRNSPRSKSALQWTAT